MTDHDTQYAHYRELGIDAESTQSHYECAGRKSNVETVPSVLFTQKRAGDRRVPYSTSSTSLYRERVLQLCRNRTVMPACPWRSQQRPSPHDAGDTVHSDVTSHGILLSSLPRPADQTTRCFIGDMDFPTDLEESFNSGALNSTLNTTMSLPTHSDIVASPPSFVTCHQYPLEARSTLSECRDTAEAAARPYAACKHKVHEKLHKQKTYQRLSLHDQCSPVVSDKDECSPVVPDKDEWSDCNTDQHHFYSGGI